MVINFNNQPLKKIAIIGVGLIGGSLGMVLKEAAISAQIIGYGRSEEKLQKAVSLKAIDKFYTDFNQGWQEIDLVILATPVGKIIPILKQLAPFLKSGAIVSDVGSTKRDLVHQAEQILGSDKYFVGAHPIAGTEKSGVEAAFPSLFQNANCIITPTAKTNVAALQTIKSIWEIAGSRIVIMDADKHDYALAAVSHLPHIAAYALVNTVIKLENEKQPLMSLSGGGFRDYTRIAASDPLMWRDICLSNKEYLCQVIDEFQNQLSKLKELIKQGDSNSLLEELQLANTRKITSLPGPAFLLGKKEK